MSPAWFSWLTFGKPGKRSLLHVAGKAEWPDGRPRETVCHIAIPYSAKLTAIPNWLRCKRCEAVLKRQ